MLNIRPATPDGIPEILQLIRELAEYEKLAHLVVATADDLRRDGLRGELRRRDGKKCSYRGQGSPFMAGRV